MGLVLLSESLSVPMPICVLLAADNLHTVMCILHIYFFEQVIECHEDLLILLLYRKNQKATSDKCDQKLNVRKKGLQLKAVLSCLTPLWL